MRFAWVSVMLLSGLASFGQDNLANEVEWPRFSIGIKYVGFSCHLKRSPHPQLFKHKLDKAGYAVFNHGILLSFDYYINERFGIRLNQSLVPFDCAGKFIGGNQIALTYRKSFGLDNRIQINAGPMYFYRKSWTDLPGYIDDGLFTLSGNGKWQRKFVWHGGSIEYGHRLPGGYFVLDWMPGIPEVFTFAPGYSASLTE